jgi:hypothetical protein
MKILMRCLLSLLLLTPCACAAQAREEVPLFSQAELDQMLAPVALYPDQLLSQVLMAATYPLEVVQAARWSREHPGLRGQEAVRAADDKAWDPSVKSLVAFPDLLAQMDADLDWTERLGDAFLAQQQQVMDTVQSLRQKAYDAGNLRSGEQVQVVREREVIYVRSAYPDVVYVPYYDPFTVYGSWWWPSYRPAYWAPWPGYVTLGYASHGGFYWGAGFNLGVGFFFGDWDWHGRYVRVVDYAPFYYRRPPYVQHIWVHDYHHRRGVPYRHPVVEHRYVPVDARPVRRHDYGDGRDRDRDYRYRDGDRDGDRGGVERESSPAGNRGITRVNNTAAGVVRSQEERQENVTQPVPGTDQRSNRTPRETASGRMLPGPTAMEQRTTAPRENAMRRETVPQPTYRSTSRPEQVRPPVQRETRAPQRINAPAASQAPAPRAMTPGATPRQARPEMPRQSQPAVRSYPQAGAVQRESPPGVRNYPQAVPEQREARSSTGTFVAPDRGSREPAYSEAMERRGSAGQQRPAEPRSQSFGGDSRRGGGDSGRGDRGRGREQP